MVVIYFLLYSEKSESKWNFDLSKDRNKNKYIRQVPRVIHLHLFWKSPCITPRNPSHSDSFTISHSSLLICQLIHSRKNSKFVNKLIKMVKLATARESRMYGSRRSRIRSEYINAGLYVFSTIVLLCGFVSQFSKEAKSGLVVLLIGLGLIIVVNIHDLFAHLAGIDYRFRLVGLDSQLLFVEFAVPAVQALGGFLFFIAILLLVLQV